MFKSKAEKKAAKQAGPTPEQLAAAPVIDLIIRYDGRSGVVSVGALGGELTYADIYSLLEAARQMMQKQEHFELQQAAKPAAAELPVSG